MSLLIKPNFFIVGAAKAGTTALWTYLNQHPEVYLSKVKEPHFFFQEKENLEFREEFKNQVGTGNQHQQFVSSLEEYLTLFPKEMNYSVVGEASASYLYSEKAAKAIFEFNPQAKILIILRNPVDRAFSHYLMNRRMGFSNSEFLEDFKTDLKKDKKGWGISHLYLELGLYAEQVKRFQHVFPSENVHIVLHEDLKINTKQELNKICKFLAIPKHDFDTEKKANQAMLPRNRMLIHWAQSSGLQHVIPQTWIDSLKSLFYQTKNLPRLSSTDQTEVWKYYEQDVDELEVTINRDLKSWKNG